MTLKDLSIWYANEKYGNIPDHARPNKKFSDAGANELTKSILAYFELKKWKAYRQNSEGRFIQGREYTDWMGRSRQEKGMYIPRSKSNKGAGDISCLIPPFGRRLEVEVKFGKDKQSPDQKSFQKEIEDMGGIYIIVKTWEDFFFQIKKIEEENEKFKR
jgi:hypothetical protein